MSEVKYTVQEIKDILFPVFEKYNINRAYLFGSYSNGRATEYSDVDILVDSKLRGLSFFALLEDATNALHKDVDMFDYSQFLNDSPMFIEIQTDGVKIYERK